LPLLSTNPVGQVRGEGAGLFLAEQVSSIPQDFPLHFHLWSPSSAISSNSPATHPLAVEVAG